MNALLPTGSLGDRIVAEGQLKAYLGPMKHSTPEPRVRFETPPGQQMQPDFTHVREGRDPLIALVATLGSSRATHVKFSAAEAAGRHRHHSSVRGGASLVRQCRHALQEGM